MSENVHIEIKGLARLQAALRQFPAEVKRQMSQAGHDASEEVLKTRGLRTYPGETSANRPPVPYYIRGSGTETAHGNLGNSEELSKQWYVRKGWSTKIGNRASYAKWVHGKDTQASAMARIGWIKLIDGAEKKRKQVTRIYQRFVNYTLAKLGL